jgi:8-oxo-dGTP pyrophosphatase MutT (NUDIX family)
VSRRDELLVRLDAHTPASPAEARSVARVRALVAWLRSPFDEHADPTHVTGSAIVVGDDGRVLLHRHKRLGMWLQPGGHAEPGEDAAAAALRETHEETGLAARHPDGGPRLVHVDVHEGPRGHVHLDLRYLLHAPADGAFDPAAGESRELAWFPAAEAQRVGDRSLAEAVVAAARALG